MNCPRCDATHPRVIDSRRSRQDIRRRRQCAGCGLRFTTYERIEVADPAARLARDINSAWRQYQAAVRGAGNGNGHEAAPPEPDRQAMRRAVLEAARQKARRAGA